ncbi:30S ribosomal protein S17e [Candidatus Woesearchaeota archaeon]|nr:hypothetical protein [uncultured archaeon]AQS32279.1 hypothetical protein [uncultured archaeon]MBS3149394.1 30S ribosomal protein S17e [Candidatus Woesearchaeota archaeon]
MGRIKTTLVKRTAVEIFTKYPDSVALDFETNKKVAFQYAEIPSKKLRNTIAGYLTRLKTLKEMKDRK